MISSDANVIARTTKATSIPTLVVPRPNASFLYRVRDDRLAADGIRRGDLLIIERGQRLFERVEFAQCPCRGEDLPPGCHPIFDEQYDGLVRYLSRLTGDPDLAADIAQAVFLVFVRRVSTIRSARACRSMASSSRPSDCR